MGIVCIQYIDCFVTDLLLCVFVYVCVCSVGVKKQSSYPGLVWLDINVLNNKNIQLTLS